MSHAKLSAALFASVLVLLPLALAEGVVPAPFQPLMNGHFETSAESWATDLAEPFVDRCFGVGHQALVPAYSPWGDQLVAWANDPGSVDVDDPAFVDDATGYPVAYAEENAATPTLLVDCDPQYREVAMLNPAEKVDDPGFMWSNDPGTTFGDMDGDGDREVRIPQVPAEHPHNLWQSVVTTSQAWSLDFDAFTFRVEEGVIPPAANVQVGFSLTPGYEQSPWIGSYWEGALLFRASDMSPGADGRVAMDPVILGEIVCPAGYTPCEDLRAGYAAADDAGKRTLLGRLRIVQTSFWSVSGGAGAVTLDDVFIAGAKTMAETAPDPNPVGV